MEGAIPSEFTDLRPRSSRDENKRYSKLFANNYGAGLPNQTGSFCTNVIPGFAPQQRSGDSVIITSFVASFILSCSPINYVNNPHDFGGITGRVFLVADTQYRSDPANVSTVLNLQDVFDAPSEPNCVTALERIDTDRFVVLAREPWTLEATPLLLQSTANPSDFQRPDFTNLNCRGLILDTDNSQDETVIGGAEMGEAGTPINVGAIYNLDHQQGFYPQQSGVTVNNINPIIGIPPFIQPQFYGPSNISPGCIAVSGSLGNGTIFNYDPTNGFRDAISSTLEGQFASGGLAWPKYSMPSMTVTPTYSFHTNRKLIDLEFDFPDGIRVTYDAVTGRPDIELFLCCCSLLDTDISISFSGMAGIYFTDGDVWGINENVKAGTEHVRADGNSNDVNDDNFDYYYTQPEPPEAKSPVLKKWRDTASGTPNIPFVGTYRGDGYEPGYKKSRVSKGADAYYGDGYEPEYKKKRF